MTRARLALALMLQIAAGCREAPPAPAAVAFRGPSGEAVTLAVPAHRIVSTMQSATEWLVALDAADRLVARTDFDRQPRLAALPSIGGGYDASPEVVASLHPDVVLGWRIRASVDLARALEPFHIPVIAVEATDTAEAFRQLLTIGHLVGLDRRADSLATGLRAELATLREEECRDGAPSGTVFVEISTDPPQTTARGTWMTELLGVACLRNVFGDLPQPWPAVSLEAIVARQPDWILTSRGDRPGERQQELLAKPGWRDLEAVRSGRILELDGDLLTRAGPGMADWVRAVIAERRRVTRDE